MRSIRDFLDLIHKDTIKNQVFITFGYQEEYRKNINFNYGYLPFLLKEGEDFKFVEKIIPLTNENNRCGKIKESTEYICIHDTASASPTADAIAHSNWLMSMANSKDSTTCVSWHFTVDDKIIINHLPIDEVGYHAGDGTKVKLEFIDTLIKKNREDDECIVTISLDGYYVLNDVKSTILAPTDDEGNILSNSNLPTLGIHTRISNNNTYLIGNTYYSKSYNSIANKGGNLNSVGIETCVNLRSDYVKTMRITAHLVSRLLVHYKLDISRVKQHNSFSGKDCPMTIRHASMWDEFIKMVEINLIAIQEFPNYKFKFSSLSKDLLADDGKIINHIDDAIVSYKVEVLNLDTNETSTYYYNSVLEKKGF